MRILRSLIFLFVISPVAAQNVTCTPDVPKETCNKASLLFMIKPFIAQAKIQIVIADPLAFKAEGDSLDEKIKKEIKVGLSWRNPVLLTSFKDTILFERDDKSCPTRVFVSTDAFRPVKVTEEEKILKIERTGTFDLFMVHHVASYVDGFVEGCNEGILTYLADESWKRRKP